MNGRISIEVPGMVDISIEINTGFKPQEIRERNGRKWPVGIREEAEAVSAALRVGVLAALTELEIKPKRDDEF